MAYPITLLADEDSICSICNTNPKFNATDPEVPLPDEYSEMCIDCAGAKFEATYPVPVVPLPNSYARFKMPPSDEDPEMSGNFTTNLKHTRMTNLMIRPANKEPGIRSNYTTEAILLPTYSVVTVPDWNPKFNSTDTAVPPPRYPNPKFGLTNLDLSTPDEDPEMSSNFTTHLKQTMMTDLMIRPANKDSEMSGSDEDSKMSAPDEEPELAVPDEAEIRSNCPTHPSHPIYGKHGTNPAPYIPGVEKEPGNPKPGELIRGLYIITLGTKINSLPAVQAIVTPEKQANEPDFSINQDDDDYNSENNGVLHIHRVGQSWSGIG